MPRPLPSTADALRILGERRTKPIRRGPPPAGRSLARYLKGLDERFGQGPQALHARWPEIVGERIARVSEPVRLVRSRAGGATLELRVAGPVAALVLHQSEDILARVNLVLGAKSAATKLRIVQGVVKSPAVGLPGVGPAQRGRLSPPLDAAAEQALAQSLEAADDRLARALSRLGRAVLSKG